jgi:homospermidine synthase
MTTPARTSFTGRILMVGFGSIGQGVLPLLLRHLTLTPDRVTIVTAETRGQKEAELYGVQFIHEPVTRSNYRTLLEPLFGPGDAVVNLSVDVSSVALIELARQHRALYIDTCIEPWLGGYTDLDLGPAERSNYALRETALALGRAPGTPTAVVTHGANPGLVSHFVKRALMNVAAATGFEPPVPADRAGWATLAQTLGVKVIHIAERDTQVARFPKKPGEFVNTWSIDGFVGEGCQPAELGWGSHERHFPVDGHRHEKGSQAAIWLARPGAATRVRTWTPTAGPIHGFLITHNEAISLADYLTVGSGPQPEYRPTVHYAYHPSDDAVLSVHEFAGRNYELQPEKRLMMDEIIEGMDELGVLLAGHAKGAYWYGSRLTIGEARELAPHNNATSLQVTAAVLGGLVWAIENPNRGLVEPEEMDHERVLQVASPYLGELAGAFTDWNPLDGRGQLFPEDIDTTDPWQFQNIRVV